MEQKKINKLIIKLKFNGYKLKESGCIPTFLFKKICMLGCDSTLDEVNELKEFTYLAMRTKDFYKRFPEFELSMEDEFEKFKKERRQ